MESPGSPRGVQKRGRAESEGTSPARKRVLPLTFSTKGSRALCDRCRGIQWADLAAAPPATKSGRRAADLPFVDRDALRRSPCPVCRLLARVVPQSLSGQCCRLVALSSSLAIVGREVRADERTEHSDCTVLFPVLEAKFADKTARQRIAQDWYEAGCLALVEAGDERQLPETGPRQVSTVVDFGLIEGWLKHCTKHHHDTCKAAGGGSSAVRGLRVIDCHSWTTIEAPASCQYFALSYVWGSPAEPRLQKESGDSTTSEAKFPPVVVDAIHVTLSLGVRYLWVDQLCIDQNDGPMKADQIAQMDKIYSHAHLTLVAAAGEDSLYGLPGIGGRQRHPQGRFSVDNVAIIQIFPHTSAQLSASRWASRGWTYQEGYLSPRRLIFTDHQVSYLCNTMYCTETVRKPQNLSGSEKDADNSSFLGMIPSASSFRGTSNRDRWDHLKRRQLVNYTKRKLTKESDSLNAILGLFRTLEPSDIRHLHGIPFREVSRAAVSWLEFPLAWHHEEVAMRRQQFPSWSWSGWEGGIRMNEPDIRVSDDYGIGLVKEDGHVLPLQDWFHQEMQSPNLSSANAPRVLRITAMTVQINFKETSWADLDESLSQMSRLAGMSFTDGIHAVLPIREDVTAMTYAYMDEDVPLDGDILGLVLRPRYQEPHLSRRPHTILLLRHGGQHYQRIGLVRVSHWPKTRAAAAGDFDPQTVYVDSQGMPLEEFSWGDESQKSPLWLQGAIERTVTIS